MREVVVTGMGLVTPIGSTPAQFLAGLLGDHHPFVTVDTAHTQPIPGARILGDVSDGLERSELALADRSTQLALRAASDALSDAGILTDEAAHHQCGVFVGCGSGPTDSVNSSYVTLHKTGRVPGLTLLRCLPSGAASAIAIRHQLRGPSHTYTSACASSTLAIGEAMRAIRHGYLDIALVGGTEAPFGDGTVKAWEALRVLAPHGDHPGEACRPFDRSRRGLVLGEGAAFFVIESAQRAANRGARMYATLAGFGSSGDGHHWTEPSVDGQVRAMLGALRDAGVAAQSIGSINAHGTGTPVGDRAEAQSINVVFGSRTAFPFVTSTKAIHGHTLGASGAIELAASIISLQTGRIPAVRNLAELDEDCLLNLVRDQRAEISPDQWILSNTFAFGGSNACLVIGRAPL
jgi:3-oxoacyl-(acyl-carrier-protein) synthase